jgi:hypothetical protein
MKGDFSRIRNNLNKHYTAVLQQQGRVALDADVNEQCAIDEHIRDTEIGDIVGPYGGPKGDCGFKISIHDKTIRIGSGRYYVDGILCENPVGERYDHQPFLITTSSADSDLLEDLTNGTDTTLCVYLEVWKRLVTALDDPCLREPALGQADTTARWQTVWRVVAEPIDASATPAPAAPSVEAPKRTLPLPVLTKVSGLASAPRLDETITTQVPIRNPDPVGILNPVKTPDPVFGQVPERPVFPVANPATGGCAAMYQTVKGPKSGTLRAKTSDDSSDCTCEPTPQAGYRGLENQLYRVEIHQGGDGATATFKWSRENGSVVAAVEEASSGVNVVVNSLGPDVNLGFQANNWVELTDDTLQFGIPPNQPGTLYQVQEPLPASLTLVLQQPMSGINPARKARVRRWDQFGDSAGSNGISVAANTWIPLENGIQVEFSKGNYQPGDYWLIPARTATGSIEWPPCGSDGREHQEPNRTVIERAPLACISWTEAGGFAIEDCRRCFNNLTTLTDEEGAGCCTFRVGDGVTSHGDFTSIGEAVRHLPPEGGEVCVLAGRYFENVEIFDRVDVTIVGCGADTRIASPSLKPGSQAPAGKLPVIRVEDSQHVKLQSLVVEAAVGCVGILLGEFAPDSALERRIIAVRGIADPGVKDVEMQDLIVLGSNVPGICINGDDVWLECSKVAMRNIASKFPAVYAAGSEIHILENWVGLTTTAVLPNVVQDDMEVYKATQSTGDAGASLVDEEFVSSDYLKSLVVAPCGIQIGGRSTDVYVERNEIEGGCGNGITLGSVIEVDDKGKIVVTSAGLPSQHNTSGTPCEVSTRVPTEQGSGTRLVVEGRLVDIHIEDNRIRDMGLCGVGPVGFFDIRVNTEIVTVEGLFIIENEINRCLNQPIVALSQEESLFMGYGAICVADVVELVVNDNEIISTGSRLKDPACGIFVLHGEGIEISRNHIIDPRTDDTVRFRSLSGYRAGILIVMVTPYESTVARLAAKAETYFAPGGTRRATVYSSAIPALRIQENVVQVRVGLALSVFGLGAFFIQGNHFGTGGAGGTKDQVLALSVVVINLGTPVEFPVPVTRLADLVAFLVAKNEGASNLGSFYDLFATNSIVGSLAPGPVMFSQNRCSLEVGTDLTLTIASVLILTLDDLGFQDNQCWYYPAAGEPAVLLDALLFGITNRVVGNRFQEPCGSVLRSCLAVGLASIASLNIASNNIIDKTFVQPIRSNMVVCKKDG